MQFLDGPKVTEAANDMSQEERNETMLAIIQAFSHQMFVEGVFNADPHPGNILVLSDGKSDSKSNPTQVAVPGEVDEQVSKSTRQRMQKGGWRGLN